MTTQLLQAHGLVKRYGGVTATDNVSLTLDAHQVMGIIGPNGAGKSTLIGLLGGGLMPSAGRIVFDGQDITAMPAHDRARIGIGRTYQIPRPFLDMTVRENLLAARYSLHPWEAGAKAKRACDAIMERTGLADAAGLTGRGLPLLRRKRLEVARALALQPKLLLLDEVGAGLIDSEVTELVNLIQSLRHDVAGIIIIEHVLRVVRECCDRLTVINFGKKIAEGSTVSVLNSDEVAAVYLGTSHAAKLTDVSPPVAQTPEAGHAKQLVPAKNAIGGLVASASAGAGAASASTRPDTPVLELRGIHAGYGQARVLNGIDLRVYPGKVIAILGTNGAGKTTLANVVSGAIQASAGAMRVEGRDITGAGPHEIARLGLAQCMEGRRIFAPLTVEENLMLAARGVSKAEVADRLERIYTLFPELKERRCQGGTSMSGGQQQMLAIGRSLMSRPKLVLFDEISLGLAPVMMDRLYLALAELKVAGLTMLIVEQDVERALNLADEVHVMEHGAFALSGSAASIRDDPRLRHLYIGTAE
jgi:branched-chain amino acid transport system ATP-binding protein